MKERKRNTPNDALSRDEEDFARRAGAQLRRSADDLDGATLSRLNRDRQKALDELSGRKNIAYHWRIPAGATAVAAIVAVGIWTAGGPGDEAHAPGIEVMPVVADDVTDFELLLENGDLEMLEDLEFFAWLAAEELEAAG